MENKEYYDKLYDLAYKSARKFWKEYRQANKAKSGGISDEPKVPN